MVSYHRTATTYLLLLGAVCLICARHIDVTTLFCVWGFTAVGLHAFGRALDKQ